MIIEIGHYALILALALSLVQATLPLIGAQLRYKSWMILAQPAALVQFGLVLASFSVLTYAYVVSDFSVLNVAMNSHSEKPLLYKISGVWGNHEGSLLLWVLILTLFGAAVAVFGGNLPPDLRARVLAVQAIIGTGFLLFMLLTSNPFERLSPVPMDGRGLNPLLQDPGLAFHPPFLYLGYVGFSMAFSFAVAALIEGKVDASWARWVRPWTLSAWCFLTIGIALGSWWAYYELGWGGFWFWDPVENASFMPWLAGTALLHSAIVVEKRGALRNWTILLSILTFSLSLLGTFLVRSGVLTSVHAFATDPDRGLFILGFLIVIVGGSLTLYAIRAPAMRGGGLFAPISREGALVFNNLLLTTSCATVLLGTLYPLFLDALTGDKVSVGPPFFHATFVPLVAPVIAAAGVGPFLAWKRADFDGVASRLSAAFLFTAGVAIATWAFTSETSVLAIIGTALGAWLVSASVSELSARLKLFTATPAETWRRAKHLPRAAYGMTLAHAGVGMMILGIVVSLTWDTERLQLMHEGESVDVGGYNFVFRGVENITGPNFDAVRGFFDVSRLGKLITVMTPETRIYNTSPQSTTEAAIYPTLGSDLYAVIGDPDGTGGWATRLYHKPLVHWIWIGALIMALGGFISLTDRRHRIGVPKQKRGIKTTGLMKA